MKSKKIINMMKKALKEKSINQVLSILCKLDYLIVRNIYVYVEKINYEKEEKKVRKNDN